MEFNRIIKLLRKERGITQKQAAEDLGVSQALLSHYEKGIRECGLDFVVRVADYYNVSCDYLLGRSAERNGMMLNADDLPNPDKMKDNVYHGSVLPTMNKKLISNSLNVLYAKIAECHSKALTTEVSTYLMMAVAKMFRLLYSAEPHNAQSLFSVEARRWPGYSDAVMRMSESNVEDLLAGEDLNGAEGVKDPSCLAMTTESLTMGDRIVVMKDGIIQQVDTPQNLYDMPCNMFVAGFIGSPQMNFLDGTVTKNGDQYAIDLGGDTIPLPKEKTADGKLDSYVGKKVKMGIRPEDIDDEPEFMAKHPDCHLEAQVDVSEMMGAEIYLYLEYKGNKMTARVAPTSKARNGDTVRVAFDPHKVHVFDVETEQTILN